MKGSLPKENYKFEFHFVNLLKFNFITSWSILFAYYNHLAMS